MFRWLKRLLSSPDNPSSKQASPAQVPETVQWYLAAIRPYLDGPFVRHHFHQVTWFSLIEPGGKSRDFYALEFRAGNRAALVWAEAPDRWYVGRYVPLAYEGADLTCSPSSLTATYWKECIALSSLPEALAGIEVATPAPFRRTDDNPT